MLTVKEFKDLGVDVAHGDKCFVRGQEYMFHSNDFDESFDGAELTFFAWRLIATLPTTLKYCIEINADKSMWRPLLDQSQIETKEEKGAFDKMKPYEFDAHVSSEKPVFTQAMAEPKIGFKFKFKHDIDGKFGFLHQEKYGWEDDDELELIHKVADHNGTETYIVLNTQPDVLSLVKITDTLFFDTRTPKQKAVDDALEAIGIKSVEGGNARRWLDMLYDADKLKC